jgi:hypothetical protein
MFLIDKALLVAGTLMILGILSSKVSARFGLPVLVLFLGLGMLAGSEGFGGIAFEDYELAHAIGTVALAFILFDGGLRSPPTSLKVAWKPAVLLATLGVLCTALVTGVVATRVLGLSLLEGLLLGSIVGSTDAAAVFSVLRSAGLALRKRIGATLEIESGANDPMAIFLTVGAIQLLTGEMPLSDDRPRQGTDPTARLDAAPKRRPSVRRRDPPVARSGRRHPCPQARRRCCGAGSRGRAVWRAGSERRERESSCRRYAERSELAWPPRTKLAVEPNAARLGRPGPKPRTRRG